mmetsp:Transcript_24986/g.79171  ORF Transcript_24986/g.79171 Transcript_24986/m.79171 type:complete len:204 (-) Transcript_24986:451-1062(-)
MWTSGLKMRTSTSITTMRLHPTHSPHGSCTSAVIHVQWRWTSRTWGVPVSGRSSPPLGAWPFFLRLRGLLQPARPLQVLQLQPKIPTSSSAASPEKHLQARPPPAVARHPRAPISPPRAPYSPPSSPWHACRGPPRMRPRRRRSTCLGTLPGSTVHVQVLVLSTYPGSRTMGLDAGCATRVPIATGSFRRARLPPRAMIKVRR